MADNDTDNDPAAGPLEEADAKPSRWPTVLITAATILTILALLTVWGRTQALDTDEWVELSTELLDEPEVQEALSVFLVDVVYDEGNVATSLEARLPDDLDGLAEPLAGVLRGPLTSAVERLLDSDQFQALWETSNRAAHETLVSILHGDDVGALTTSDGAVALELKPIVVEVAKTIGLSGERLDEIPDDAGRIIIFESDELDAVQELVRVLEFLAWFLFVLVVLLYALAVYLAHGRRIRVLRSVGWSLMVVGSIVLLARALAVRTLVNAIVDDPGDQDTAAIAGSVVTALLRQMGVAAFVYGLLIVGFATLLGEGRRATATRRALAPALNASTGAVVAGTAGVILVLIWWSPGRAFEGWTTGLTLIALLVAATVTLRRRTLLEFSDTTFDDAISGIGSESRAERVD
jgi:hypothetical protein